MEGFCCHAEALTELILYSGRGGVARRSSHSTRINISYIVTRLSLSAHFIFYFIFFLQIEPAR